MKTATSFGSILTRFFTQRPHGAASRKSTYPVFLSGHIPASAQIHSCANWKAAVQSEVGRHRRGTDRRVLDDLEHHRGIAARSRNLRLTAIRSLFRFAAFELPEHFNQIQQVLAIPPKRVTHQQIGYLSRSEQDMLLSVPDRSIWAGRRDHAWMLLATQTGLRLSELTGLVRSDIHLGPAAYVHVVGKGRKERCTPLTSQTTEVLRTWLAELPAGETQVIFPSRRGHA